MNKNNMIAAVIAALVIIAVGAYAIAGSTGSSHHASSQAAANGYATSAPTTAAAPSASNSSSAAYAVKLVNSSVYGMYLANSSGFTLYIYGSDTPNSGTSTCTGGCAGAWPPFYASNLTLPSGLNASSFGTITRAGGAKQLTYKGYPLYLYSGDSQPLQVNGNNVAGFKVAVR